MSSPERHCVATTSFSDSYGGFAVRWRWPLLLIPVILCLAAAYGGQYLRPSGDYRVFFSEDNPQLLAFEKVQDTYTKIDNILFAVQPAGEDVFSAEIFAAVEDLTEAAWTLPHAIRVDSLSNFQHTRAEGDDLYVADLIRDGAGFSEEQVEYVRSVAISEPAIINRIVAPDSGATGINVTIQLPGLSLEEMPNVANAALKLGREIEERHSVRVELTGMIMLNHAFTVASLQDLSTLVPLMYLVIVIVILALVRSVAATIGATLVTLFSIVTAMGLAGWAGMLITPPSAGAPTVIATLAVADSIHFLISMFAARRKGLDRRAAVVESLRVNLQPIFLTSVTTAIGFLSMNFSDAPPLRHLGNAAATGVMAAFIFSITLLPAFMAIVPSRVGAGGALGSRMLDGLAELVIARKRTFLVATTLFALGAVAFLPRNSLQDDFVGYFDESLAFRQASDFTNEELTGLYQHQYSIPSGSADGVSDPAFLEKLDRFAVWLRSQPEVRHVNTISDTFKRLNKSLHGDEPSWYRLPDQLELGAQYLLLYELSLPYGLDLNNQLDVDKSATQVIATLSDLTSIELKEVAERGERWLSEELGIETIGVGPSLMFAHISDRTIGGMIWGTTLALIAISGILLLALRSFKMGFISLIPNLLPAGIAFGLWGLLVGEVNVGVSIVIGMTIGIVVDDTVHFLSKYLRARREQNASAEDSVRYAFRSVGAAILTTSIVLLAGFGVLTFSVFGMNELMSKLTMVTILVALLTDFLLLPVLLIYLDGSTPAARQAVPERELVSVS